MNERIPIRKRILFAFFDKVVNMNAAQIRSFRNSEAGQKCSQTEKEAYSTGGLAGKEISPDIEKMISKASKYRGQYKELPNWTPYEWKLASSLVRFIARFRKLSTKFTDSEGNPTKLSNSMKVWGHDYQKYKKRFPKSHEVKTDVREFVKKEKEAADKKKEKLNEDLDIILLNLNLDIE